MVDNERMKASAIVETTYKLKLITPMAMHGANAGEKAEFRISSLRGVWRYWWRTLQEEKNHAALLEQEEEWFGGTQIKKQKSPVNLLLQRSLSGLKRESILPHRTKKSFAVRTIPAGQETAVVMRTLQKHKQLLETYELYFQYMLHLAGMGQRARRGFGAVQWEGHHWETIADFVASLQEVLIRLGQSERFQFSDSGCIVKRKGELHTSHPVLSAVWVGEGQKTPQEVLKRFGVASHEANRYGRLGAVRPKRFASPLWCTVRKIGDLYYPVVTEVKVDSSVYKQPQYQRDRDLFLEIAGVRV
ncbi:type III-B CRISPR module RAMP protein Cmr1 [Parageobacillus thermoglucosidasius]|uniref:type III-B CRISPR module RAMP protein Cmr1 n=1 Tax=Parageobacillus thermoglucosidasius TaxID=1426 RepID=UPI003B66FC5F